MGGKAYLESVIALWGMSVGATGRMRSTSRMVASSSTRWFRSLTVGVRLKPTFCSISSWIFFCSWGPEKCGRDQSAFKSRRSRDLEEPYCHI